MLLSWCHGVLRGWGGGGVQVLVPYLGNLTGGHTTPDVTGVPLKGVLFDLSHLGLSCQVMDMLDCLLWCFVCISCVDLYADRHKGLETIFPPLSPASFVL